MLWSHLMAICAIFFGAGLLQGLTGFGSALFAMPLLTFFIDFKSAVPLCLLNGMVITGYLTFQLRRYLTIKTIGPMLIGALPGILFGTLLLKSLPIKALQLSLGILLTTYCIWALLRPPVRRKLGSAWSYIAGFVSGAVGATIGTSGPPVIIYVSLSNWSKDYAKATLTGFFITTGLLTLISQGFYGLITPKVLKFFAFSGLWVLLGTHLGVMLYGKLDTVRYLRLVIFTLLLLGITLILKTF